MGYRLGVDLGTTFTSAAVSRDGRAEPVTLGDHAHEIPSVVSLRSDGGYVVGDAAVARETDQPDRVAREFKRRIGDETSIFLGGVPTSAHALTAVVLRHVVDLVHEREGRPADQVVLTCPANWGPFRREMFQHALQMAGVADGVLCTEPEAAALQFGTTDRLVDGDVVAVYDLGGGTFDAALLRRDGDTLGFVGRPEGIEQLGGLDFDAALFGHVVGQLRLEGRDPDDEALTRGLIRLRRECVLAKERLSYDVDTTVPVDLPGAPSSVRVTRGELEENIAPLVHETIDCLERVLRRGEIAPDDLTAVLLVGGSARVPLVRQLLTERLGRPLPPSPQPKLCVALGASLFGALPAASPQPPPRQPVVLHPASTVALPVPSVSVEPTPSRVPETQPVLPIEQATASTQDRRPVVYGVACALLAVGAVATAFLGQRVPQGVALEWGEERRVVGDASELAGVTTARVELLGQHPWPARTVTDGSFHGPSPVLVAGPLQVELQGADEAGRQPQQAFIAQRSLVSSLLTVPGLAAVFGLLYAFAYGETLLRGVRRRTGDVRAAEVLGMTGVGAIAGAAAAVAAWWSGRVLATGPVALTVALTAAAGGLLAFAVGARVARRSARSAAASAQ